MLSVKATYDGKELKFRDKIKIDTPHEVIVTFLDESEDDITSGSMHKIAAEGGAFQFLNDAAEDIYSDKDLKVRY